MYFCVFPTQPSDTVIVTIIVSDVNDNPPVFENKTYELSMEENDNTPVNIEVSIFNYICDTIKGNESHVGNIQF